MEKKKKSKVVKENSIFANKLCASQLLLNLQKTVPFMKNELHGVSTKN